MRTVNRKRLIQGAAIVILSNVAGYIVHSGDFFQIISSWIMMFVAGGIVGYMSLEER